MLNREQVAKIESAKRAGRSIRATARALGLDRSTVRQVFRGQHPVQRGRRPAQPSFSIRRFLRAVAEVFGPFGVELRTSGQRTRYERIRAQHERPGPSSASEEDEEEPVYTSCDRCGFPLVLEWACSAQGEKHLVVVADGRIVRSCPNCKRRFRGNKLYQDARLVRQPSPSPQPEKGPVKAPKMPPAASLGQGCTTWPS